MLCHGRAALLCTQEHERAHLRNSNTLHFMSLNHFMSLSLRHLPLGEAIRCLTMNTLIANTPFNTQHKLPCSPAHVPVTKCLPRVYVQEHTAKA